ncbi:uncharacterized protein LOC128551821 [Mercenaria mercenaria]|uniref:uncharacterized protein LOC128551821 n=1 Tax=Mercenaria mercenaria TaxID=6596 RepID=UPI00234EA6E9|nr:uncharacterized protein LOC128551821 [Mercenaria mercenaria]
MGYLKMLPHIGITWLQLFVYDILNRSGEEEDLTEKTVLLQECLDLQREAETVLQKERDAKEDQKSKDEETGKNIRKRALEGLMKSNFSSTIRRISRAILYSVSYWIITCTFFITFNYYFKNLMIISDETTRKAPKMSPLDFLKMKTEAEKDIKEKEMELKKRELSLQEQRFELEREERRAAIELQKRQSDAMLKLIEKMN